MRLNGIQDNEMMNCRFDIAEETDLIKKCKNYVSHYEEVLSNNIGLLFWGNVDGGKTFAAACIANAFIDMGIPSLITSFPKIMAVEFEDRYKFIQNISKYSLLVLDDLGTERGTDYSLEMVYTVIDERKKSKKPMIVTTNLTLSELQNPKNMEYKRIYSRVLEMCTPVMVKSMNYRGRTAKEKRKMAIDILGG